MTSDNDYVQVVVTPTIPDAKVILAKLEERDAKGEGDAQVRQVAELVNRLANWTFDHEGRRYIDLHSHDAAIHPDALRALYAAGYRYQGGRVYIIGQSSYTEGVL